MYTTFGVIKLGVADFKLKYAPTLLQSFAEKCCRIAVLDEQYMCHNLLISSVKKFYLYRWLSLGELRQQIISDCHLDGYTEAKHQSSVRLFLQTWDSNVASEILISTSKNGSVSVACSTVQLIFGC